MASSPHSEGIHDPRKDITVLTNPRAVATAEADARIGPPILTALPWCLFARFLVSLIAV